MGIVQGDGQMIASRNVFPLEYDVAEHLWPCGLLATVTVDPCQARCVSARLYHIEAPGMG